MLPFSTKCQKSEKEDNSVKYLQNFAKIESGHLQLIHIAYTKHHDPSSFCSQCSNGLQ